MVNDQEISGSSRPNSSTEVPPANKQERLGLYKDILYKEATSLLGQYLPEALPREPTKVAWCSYLPRYEGKFRGTHYITTLSEATEDLAFKEMKARFKENLKRHQIEVLSDPGDAVEEKEKDNWDELTGALNTRQGYSVNTWSAIQTTIHELIHQRQEELNPAVSQDLSSPELDRVDLDRIDTQKLWNLIKIASVAAGRAKDINNLFWPVIEGMADVGCFYIMKKLEEDLIKAGDTESAAKVGKARSKNIHESTTRIYRDLKTGKLHPSQYAINYLEGARLVRKLYKYFGETTPKLLTQVDLQACQQITKGSPQYQQIMENPALLPGLSHVAQKK